MAQPGEQDQRTSAKRTAPRKPVARAAKRSVVTVKAGGQATEVAVSKERYARIAARTGAVGKVIAGYADTAAKAKRTGTSHLLVLRVTPDGKIEAVTEKPATDPLEVALAAARARGQAKVADILKDPDMLTGRDFAPLIGASHETVNARRKRGEVLGLEGATRGVRYPRWQVTEAGLPLPGLADLFAILGGQPWAVYRFLRAAHAELNGNTAVEALKEGRVEAVLAAARNQAAGVFG